MGIRKIAEYGYVPDEHKEGNGRHAVIYDVLRNFENRDKEPRILAKVLHFEGKGRAISAYSESRDKFIADVINPLKQDLKMLDDNFGDYIPPYYLEVSEEDMFDSFNNLNVPTILYSYKVERVDIKNSDEQKLFEEQFKLFIKKSISFLKSQVESSTYPLLLPDIKLSNFIFGTHMGDPKKRLYFIDQYPPFLTAGRTIQNLKVDKLESNLPFIGDELNELYGLWESINNDHHDYDTF